MSGGAEFQQVRTGINPNNAELPTISRFAALWALRREVECQRVDPDQTKVLLRPQPAKEIHRPGVSSVLFKPDLLPVALIFPTDADAFTGRELKVVENLLKSVRIEARSSIKTCLLYTSPSPRDATLSRMPSSA